MDTSKEYIEMCDHALLREYHIQKYGEGTKFLHNGNLYADGNEEDSSADTYHECQDYYCSNLFEIGRYHIWLPRQDQLQGMVKDLYQYRCGKHWFHNMGPVFNVFAKDYFDIVGSAFNKSIETCWLAFVMKEKFGKTWRDGEWK